MSSPELTHITVFQPEGPTVDSPKAPPYNYVALKNTPTGSKEFPLVLSRFLLDQEQLETLRELDGPSAAKAADFLDELITTVLSHESCDRRQAIRVLHWLCKGWGILPASCTLQGEVEVDLAGGWSLASKKWFDMWSGTWGSEKVAIRSMRTDTVDRSSLKEALSKEAIIWKHLKHPNLLPLYGVCASVKVRDFEWESPSLVFPWMENGNICSFVRENPTFNRIKLLVDVCEGLIYLHSEGFVHGWLNTYTVLVDSEKRVRLADFCPHDPDILEVSRAYETMEWKGTWAHFAPETTKNSYGTFDSPMEKPVDVYALGSLIFVVLAGNLPFGFRKAMRFSTYGGSHKRPSWTPIPDHPIWDLVESCWEEDPNKRPQVTEILNALTSPGVAFPEVWPSPEAGSIPELDTEPWMR